MKKIGERRDAVIIELTQEEYGLFIEIVLGGNGYPIQYNMPDSDEDRQTMLNNLKIANKIFGDIPYAIKSLQKTLDSLNKLGEKYGV